VAISRGRPVISSHDKLDVAVATRLREIVAGDPATESELRAVADRAGGWARALEAQVAGSEARLAALNLDPTSPLADIASEVRRLDALMPELEEARWLLAGLERRTRELRTEWLRHHAESAPRLS
jgi:hypothetical protein